MKFGIKKSHEMISSIPIGIAPLSEWNHRPSTKPCKLTQMTLVRALLSCCFDQSESLISVLVMRFDLKQKV
jgi:hypothetical protein